MGIYVVIWGNIISPELGHKHITVTHIMMRIYNRCKFENKEIKKVYQFERCVILYWMSEKKEKGQIGGKNCF